MKKRIAMSIMTIALVAALICGSTMSLFTDSVTVLDKFHAGTVAIRVNGQTSSKRPGTNATTCCYNTPTDAEKCWNPGDDTIYPITIENIGTKSVYVRFKIECTWLDDKDGTLNNPNQHVDKYFECGWDISNCKKIGQYYYYNTALSGSAEKEGNNPTSVSNIPLHITFDKNAENKYQGKDLQVSIKVDAVQYRHNEGNLFDPTQWPNLN